MRTMSASHPPPLRAGGVTPQRPGFAGRVIPVIPVIPILSLGKFNFINASSLYEHARAVIHARTELGNSYDRYGRCDAASISLGFRLVPSDQAWHTNGRKN